MCLHGRLWGELYLLPDKVCMRRFFCFLTVGKVASCWNVFERTKHVIIAGARQDVPSPRKFICRRMSVVWTAVSGRAFSCRNASSCVTIPHRFFRIRGLNRPPYISLHTVYCCAPVWVVVKNWCLCVPANCRQHSFWRKEQTNKMHKLILD